MALALMLVMALVAVPAWPGLALPAAGRPDQAALCERASSTASRRTGVPLSVLRAIALTETGRGTQGTMRPWPWTVNMEGAGHWFDDRGAALAYVLRRHADGADSFDIGCFQINHRWHGEAFASIGEMFDPLANAIYAARFLKSLYAETGDWGLAAGAYHSRTKKLARRYQAIFEHHRARFDNDIAQMAVTGHRASIFVLAGSTPLIFAGRDAKQTPGSLTPVGHRDSARSLIARTRGQP